MVRPLFFAQTVSGKGIVGGKRCECGILSSTLGCKMKAVVGDKTTEDYNFMLASCSANHCAKLSATNGREK